jgi:ligand-binding sensor domain-containing protein
VKNQGSIVAVIVVCVLGLVVVLVGSLAKKPKIVETQAIADDFTATEALEPPEEYHPVVSTVLVDEGRMVIASGDGIYIKPSLDDVSEPEKREPGAELRHLNAILPIGDRRYVAGDGLYLLDDNYSMLLDAFDFGQRVYALMEFGEGILIGTEQGLWYHSDLPLEEGGAPDTLLKGSIIVTALVEDRGGLWVGTHGDGLYRFDGQRWQERFLERDTLIFSFVNALEYSYPFLWVGTDQAIFRFDGGSWAQMFVSDSSETHDVTCIMTTPAATYIGTGAGLLRYAGDKLTEDEFFEGSEIVGLCRSEKGVIVATREDGIFTFNGKEEIVSPEQLNPHIFAADEQNEIIAGTLPEAIAEGTDY